jgi:hypothetical protein
MYDSDGTLRLKQGLDKATDAFVFELYDSDSKKTVYLDSGGNEVLDGKLQLTDSGNNLMIAFKDTKGGVVKLYDTGGLLNVKIGVESGAESNTGGTLILYLDSPYDTAPDADVYQRVGIGIRSDYKAGCFNLIDDNTKVRVSGTADSAIGPYIGVRNSAEELISYITETAGYVNGVKIATMNDISSWTVKTGTLTDPPSISVGQYYWDTVNNMPIFKGSDGWYDALGNLIG